MVEFHAGLSTGPLGLAIGFVILLAAVVTDEYVSVEYTRAADNVSFTNHYGIFTAELYGLHGMTRNSRVLLQCDYGLNQPWDADKLTNGCESNCKARKALAVLSLFLLWTAIMCGYDVWKMEVHRQGRVRATAAFCGLFGVVFAIAFLAVIAGQMDSTWKLPAGSGAIISGDYGVCDYKMMLRDTLTLRRNKTPDAAVSFILGWIGVGFSALGVSSLFVQMNSKPESTFRG